VAHLLRLDDQQRASEAKHEPGGAWLGLPASDQGDQQRP